MQWFRCYADIADNYKLKMLAYEDRWHYIAILSCKSLGMLDGKRQEFVFRTVAMRLGLTVGELEEVARRLAEYNLIEQKNLQPIGWNERQFISDNSTERVRKHRIYKKSCNVSETLVKRKGNAPDTDTDTDTEKPIKALSGKPDDSKKLAIELLEFLNLKSGKNFHAVDANIKMIQARLREYPMQDLKSMIALKCRAWRNDEVMVQYIRPGTLFNATKCAQYVGELIRENENGA